MDHVEKWRLRRRIEYLESISPVGHTSLVTVLVRPDDQMYKVRNMITDEISKANNVKSAQNRSSVQEGLRSIGEYFKTYKTTPGNGIACYFGSSVCEPLTGKEKRLKMYFEPPKPLRRFVYNCDATAHTTALREMIKDEEAVGFIVMDGKGAMFTVIRGNEKDVKCSFSVDLPRKHGRGGQSAARFARRREELRNVYLNQVCEKATSIFISDDKPNVTALILAGQAQFKEDLEKSPHLDPRLRAIVKLTVTVAYGEHHGLDEAIKLSADALANIRLTTEIRILEEFMALLKKGSDDMVTYGIRRTIQALEDGAVLTLLVWENLPTLRYLLRDPISGETLTKFLPPGNSPSSEQNVIEAQPLIEWLVDHVSDYGSKLELVTDHSQEGSMLKLGFDGIASILRYSRVPDESPENIYSPTEELEY